MDLGDKPIVAFRAAVLRLYLAITAAVSVLIVPLYYFIGIAPLTLACTVFGVVMVGTWWLFRGGHLAFGVAARVFLGMTFLVCMTGLWLGDETIDNKPWQLLVPLAAFTVVGAREGLRWALAGFVAAATICIVRWPAYAMLSVIVLLIAHATMIVALFFYTRHSEDNLRTVARLSHTDSLTGVYNRHFFDELAQHAFNHARRTQEGLTVFMIDIDHFKAYNDTYGHVAGDRALTAVAQVLRQQGRRSTDLVFRYGGEEFCIISTGLDAAQALALGTQIRATIEARDIRHEAAPEGRLTVSIGIAQRAPSDELVEQLLRRADAALYRAKRGGRNRLEFALSAAAA